MSDNDVPVYQNYIAGEWVDAASAGQFDIFDPATGEVIHRAPNSGVADMQQAIDAANEAFETTAWREDTELRTKALFKLADAPARSQFHAHTDPDQGGRQDLPPWRAARRS